jgi:SSS family solute:Na+ symporter
MTMDLLFPGAIGLMMAGVLSAKMSSLAGSSVSYSALFIRNLYQPFVKPKSDRHLINVGRVAIGVTLLGGVGVALFIGNLLTCLVPSRPPFWRHLARLPVRQTKTAVIAQVFICFATRHPNVFQSPSNPTKPGFLRETNACRPSPAVREDVAAGRAAATGEVIRKERVNPPQGIFYEKVARIDPEDPASPKIGIGRFHAELWVVSWLGIDFAGFSKAKLSAVRFGFDALFPFVLLFLLSAVTRPVPKADLDRFFARVHTPVQPTPEAEERALRHAVEHYEEIEREAQAGLELGDHEAAAHRYPRLRRLLAPRRGHHLPALAHGEYPLGGIPPRRDLENICDLVDKREKDG